MDAQLLDLIDYEKEHSNTAQLEIPTRAIPRVFGRNGAALRELTEETGAQIDVGRSETSTVPITVRGTKTAVAEARKRLLAIGKEVEDEAVVEINIERSLHLALIGKGGQNSA
jgi:polyribonucleotide nucleotidyltransferase